MNSHERSPFQTVDTHCHLFMPPLADDLDNVLSRARTRSVERLIVPAYDPASWPAVAALARRPGVFGAIGLHPWVAATVSAREIRDLLVSRLDADFAPVAIGEIGLDAKLDDGAAGLPIQLAVLRPQLELARDLDLPVILHCRGAFAELLAELDRFGGELRGVLHAWSRGPELAARFRGAGLALGIGGAVTRSGARRVRRTVKNLPLEAFVLETDAPSIGLEGVPSAETEPAHVADIAGVVAELRRESPAVVAAVTTAYACRLFGLAEAP